MFRSMGQAWARAPFTPPPPMFPPFGGPMGPIETDGMIDIWSVATPPGSRTPSYIEEPPMPSGRQGYPFTMPEPPLPPEEEYPSFETGAQPYDVTRYFLPTEYPTAFPKAMRGGIPARPLWHGRF